MRRRSPGILWLAVAGVLAASVAPAEAGRVRARAASGERTRVVMTKNQAARAAALRQRGLEHYVSREYQLASDALMEAYRIDKRAETLFSWAEAVRANGDCELASRIYGRLLAKTSNGKLTAQAEAGLAACADQLAAGVPSSDVLEVDGEPVAEPADVVVIEDEEPVAEAPVAPVSIEASHTASYILLGTGGTLAIGGLLTYATASTGSSLPNATHAQTTSARSRGDWYRLIGASIAATGVTIGLIGVVVYRSENRAAADARLSVAPYVGSAGAGIALSGSF